MHGRLCIGVSQMKTTDWLRLTGLSIVWGGTFLFQGLAVRTMPPLTVTFCRVFFAAAVFWLLVLATKQHMPRDRHTWSMFFTMGLINNAIPFSLITWEQTHVEGGIASIMNATVACFAVVLAHFLTRDEKLTARKALGVTIGFLGAYVLLRPELQGGVSMRGFGELAGLLASLSLALAGIFGKRFKAQPPMVTATGMLTCSSLIMFPLIMVVDQPWTLVPNAEGAGAIAGLVLLSTVVAYVLYFSVLRSAGATNLLLVTLLMPISAHILGALFLSEPLYVSSALGMLCILVGLSIIDGRFWRRLRRVQASGSSPLPLPIEGDADERSM